MAILNLAGNFQPTPVSNGKSLPQISNHKDMSQTSAGVAPENTTKNLQQSSTTETVKSKSNADTNQALTVKQDVIKDQIKELQQFNQKIDRSLQFKVDEELGVTIVRVIDKETEELIRQFPPEELINLSRRLKDLNEQQTSNSGVLLQEKV
ncbi:MAG: flagellar protein FlaG [Enterobacterales bacterium]|nr:flagellar protein FlaG [Enterobacterales bacterium]